MNYVKEYNKRLQTGKIEACEEIKSIYKRLVKEMDDDSSPFWFSEEQGEYVIGFIEGFCKHYQGEHAGEYVRLELFHTSSLWVPGKRYKQASLP